MEDIGKLCKEFEKTFSLFAMIASGKIIIVIRSSMQLMWEGS